MEVMIIENQELIEYIYKLDKEYRIPLIDELTHYKVKIKKNKATATIFFNAHKNPEMIEGFLKLADYFKTIIIRNKNSFFISANSILMILEF